MFKKMDDETYEKFWKEFSTKLACVCTVIIITIIFIIISVV